MKCLSLLIIIIALFSCSKDEGLQEIKQEHEIQLNNLVFSGCKGDNSSSSNEEFLLIEPIGKNKILVTHQNVKFNCCTDEPNIELKIKDNKITVNESSSDPVCNCVCPFDVQFSIEDLSPGKYSFELSYHEIQKTKLDLEIPLTKKIKIDL